MVPQNVVTTIDKNDQYQYGFNGQMSDDEWAGTCNHLDFLCRGYDPRIGRFESVDPLTAQYPWYTPYQFAGNSPIRFIDIEGKEPFDPISRFFVTDAAITMVQHPTSTKAKVYAGMIGVGGSVQNAITGTGTALRHPIETGKGLISYLGQSQAERTVNTALNMYQQYGYLPSGPQDAAVKAHVATDITMMLLPFAFKGGSGGVAAADASASLSKSAISQAGADFVSHYNSIAYEYFDCSDLAAMLERNIGGEIIELTPKKGQWMNGVEYGKSTEFTYHQVVEKDGYIYDPMYGANPVPKAEFMEAYNKMNPEGLNVQTK